jgi:four helix bundle protein
MNDTECKPKNVLSERLINFAVEAIRISEKVQKSFSGRQIAGQLIRSATSAGANYEEACGAESRADFIHKLQIVLKELRESLFWLRLISKSGLISVSTLPAVINEADELANMIAKSIVTAKKNR